jgi:hypothetical protein
MSCRLIVGSSVVMLLMSNVVLNHAQTPLQVPAPANQSISPACTVTNPIHAASPSDPNADLSGRAPWYINSDRSIWASWDYGHWKSGPQGNKVLWIRPQGQELAVNGRRIDGNDTTPLKVSIPCCYPTGFQATRLYFPDAGCWEVTATSGRSELKFVTKVF